MTALIAVINAILAATLFFTITVLFFLVLLVALTSLFK